MTDDDIVECAEILVKEANERRWLGALAQKRKALKICQ
jgi:hypothetical protein